MEQSISEKLVEAFLEDAGPFSFQSSQHAGDMLEEWLIEAIEDNIEDCFFLDVIQEWQKKLNYLKLGSLVMKRAARCSTCYAIGHTDDLCTKST
jgi:hypothetical protein